MSKNKPFARFTAVVVSLMLVSSANAYELGTHARLTYKAYEQSVLVTDPSLAKNLGIDINLGANQSNPFGDIYYDASGNAVQERQANSFEVDFMTERPDNPNPALLWGNNPLPLSLPGWLLRGAIREDDYPFGPNPMDDPVNAFRPRNHFYDPAQNRALTTILGLSLGEKAPDWGLGTSDVFGNPSGENTFRNNHYSVYDAREALYRALTGKKKDGSDAGPDSQPATEAHRKAYWATLFRALGDIVHLVQDMAQPQHTRNDMHSGILGYGHKSVYELYLDCRATGGRVQAIDNYQDYYLDACGSLTYTGYATPVFTKYSDYFSTRDGSGKGLADYSNRNFFTAGTNLSSHSKRGCT